MDHGHTLIRLCRGILPLLLLFMANNLDYEHNKYGSVATVIRALVGSFGLLIAVPHRRAASSSVQGEKKAGGLIRLLGR